MGLIDSVRKPAVGGTLAGAILLTAVVYGVLFGSGEPTGPKEEVSYWYYDVSEKKLFEGPTNQFAPIASPSGGEGVRAYVYSCSDCSDETSWFIGYLFKNSDGAKKLLVESADMTGGPNYQTWYDGQLVRAEEGDEWVNIHTKEGTEIKSAASKKCSGKAIECRIEK